MPPCRFDRWILPCRWVSATLVPYAPFTYKFVKFGAELFAACRLSFREIGLKMSGAFGRATFPAEPRGSAGASPSQRKPRSQDSDRAPKFAEARSGASPGKYERDGGKH